MSYFVNLRIFIFFLINLFYELDFVYEFLKQGGFLFVCENQDFYLVEIVIQIGIFMFWVKSDKNYFGKLIEKNQ